MSDLKAILNEITDLTNSIETDDSEFCKYVDEDPMTVPIIENPNMRKKGMQEYLDDLKQYVKIHKTV